MEEIKKLNNYKSIRKQPYLWGFTTLGFTYCLSITFALLFSIIFFYQYIVYDIVIGIMIFLNFIYFKFLYGKEIVVIKSNKFPKELNELNKDE